MTYLLVLGLFVLPPLFVLIVIVPGDYWRWLRGRTATFDNRPYLILLIHALLALIYTTPWDNYLVANGIWTYTPDLVSGLRLGWVPLEEYLFFVLQSFLSGLWVIAMLRKIPRLEVNPDRRSWMRIGWLASFLLLWGLGVMLLATGWRPGAYAALILVWSLIPVMVQVAFGADILWANRRAVVASILPSTLYLWVVDALAIRSGTWTIDPNQSMGVMIAGLPLEEMLFFLMTNLIIALGVILMLDKESYPRVLKIGRTFSALVARVRLKADSSSSFAFLLGGWVVILVATPIALWAGGDGIFPILASLGVLAQLAVTLRALGFAWPARKVAGIFLVVVALTWTIEALGIATRFPFGGYEYRDHLQPQLGGVPWLIPLAWMMMLPPAWAVSQSILIGLRSHLGRWYWFVFAALAGLAFTAWDLYLDPQMVKRGLWVWQQPGGYFGIPWGNFVGWWAGATLITLLIRPDRIEARPLILVYATTWILQAVGLGIFWGQPGPALVGFLGMGVFYWTAVCRTEHGRSWFGPDLLIRWRRWSSFFGLWRGS